MSTPEGTSRDPGEGWTATFGVTENTVATAVDAVQPVTVDGGALLVDRRTRGVHRVNPSAAAVFALCGGDLDVGAIAAELAGLFRVEASDIVDEVAGTVAQYRALGLVILDGDPPATAAPDPGDGDPRHVPVPCSACQDNIDARGWGPTVAIAVGDKVVGVRGHDDATSHLVRRRFASRVVDDPGVPANWSVVLVDDATPPPGPHRRSGLYEGHQFITVGRDHRTILDLLDRRVAGHVRPGEGQVILDAGALVGDRGAALIPWLGRHPEPGLAEAALRIGGRLLAAPVVVNVATATLAAGTGDDRPDDPPALVALVSPGSDTTRLDGTDAAIALIGLVTAIGGPDEDYGWQDVADLGARLSVVTAAPDKQADVAAALVRSR